MIVLGKLYNLLAEYGRKAKVRALRSRFNFPASVAIGELKITGSHVQIGVHTYYNSGAISASAKAPVQIGKWCAIGYNVSIVACTHDSYFPTGPENLRPSKELPVSIGNGVWIGNNVVILPGTMVGDYAVLGANSVITGNIPPYSVVAGVPARIIYTKDPARCREHVNFVQNH